MASADEVMITTATEHTTDLAKAVKEYAVIYEKWQNLEESAKRALAEAERFELQANDLKPEVDKLREQLRGMIGGSDGS